MSAEPSEVIRILMGMKEDLGEIRANSVSMKETMEAHIVEDKSVESRVKDLEMRVEREKGFFKAWQLVGVLIGSAAGYAIQAVVSYFRNKHP